MNFNDKVVIVTGGSSGIGAATAIAFAENGANVAIVGRNQEKLKKVAETCEQKGGKALIIVADVSKDPDVKRIIDETIRYFGKINVLVNNAGIGAGCDILDANLMDLYDKVMATNLRGAVHVAHLAAPHLVETKGNIVNISSIGGIGVASRRNCVYGASKAGLDHFSRCIALTLASKGVRVNTINPGPVKTDIVANSGLGKAAEKVVFETFRLGTALDRVADPEEIADLVLFLASDKARSITGSSYVTDNGSLLKGLFEVSKRE